MPTERKRTRTPSRREKAAIAEALKAQMESDEALPVRRKRRGPQKERLQQKRREERGAPNGEKRMCKGFNLFGEPCKAPPLHAGREIEDVAVSGNYCLAHDPDISPDYWKRSFCGGQRVERPMEALANAFAKAPALLFEKHFEALGLEWDPETKTAVPKIDPKTGKRARGATHIGFSREGVARKSRHKDLALQTRISEQLADRLYGKARVSMELGAGSGVGVVVIPKDENRAMEVAQILAEVGALPESGPLVAEVKTEKKASKKAK